MTTARRSGARARKKKSIESPDYLDASRRPLQILVFLLPLIITYELGLVLLLRSDEGTLTNVAHGAIVKFLDSFSVLPAGLYLGGAVIVVVLLVWHVLLRESWKVDLGVAGLMAAESALLAVPLVAAGQFIMQTIPAAATTTVIGGAPAPAVAASLPPPEAVLISFGAGLYEELLFRMILIAILHTLLVDVCKATNAVGSTIAVVVSAVAFAAYHPLSTAAGGIAWPDLVFYLAAGIFFGTVYVWRGFGIVVGTHAAYDILAIWLLPALFAGSSG